MPPAIGPKHTVKINGKSYYLALKGSEPIYGTGTRALQDVPSDHWRLVYDDFSRGVGADFLTGDDFLTTVKGKLYPRPAVTTIDYVEAGYFHDWFESGNYLYALTSGKIHKFDISVNPPTLMRIYGVNQLSTGFDTHDLFGQSALMYSARATAGYRRYIPLNNGTRILALDTVSTEASQAFSPVVTLNGAIDASVTSIVYTSTGDPIAGGDTIIIESERIHVRSVVTGTNTLTVVRGFAGTTAASHADTTAVTQATPDTLTFVTAVTTVAAHFQQMPDGKVWRTIAQYSAGVTTATAKVSALTAGADCEVNANWGQAFPVDDQTVDVISMMNYDELLIIGKQNGYFAATQNADQSGTWRTILPDANIFSRFNSGSGFGADHWRRGVVWHGKMMLPPDLYRSVLSSSVPVGPDAIPENTGDEAAASTRALRYGYISQVTGIGEWLYAPYTIPGVSTEVLVGREAHSGDLHEVPWGLLFKTT